MATPSPRLRASERPEQQAHWGGVWIEADRRAPFRIEGLPDRPRRPWWKK